MRNIEEDIEKIKQLNNLLKFFKTHGWIPDLSREINTNGTIEAIEHMLTEQEADKKRIKELEVLEDDLKDKRVVYIDTPEFAENYIPKQKVKDKIEELNNNRPYLMKFEDWRKKEYTNEDIIQNCIEVLEELLEDK